MENIKVTENEMAILKILVEEYDTSDWGETGYYPFAPLEKKTGLDRRHVRLACRSLKRKGLAQFAKGLMTEDGMGGAGYGATKEGYILLNPCDISGCKDIVMYDFPDNWSDLKSPRHKLCEKHHEEYKKSLSNNK